MLCPEIWLYHHTDLWHNMIHKWMKWSSLRIPRNAVMYNMVILPSLNMCAHEIQNPIKRKPTKVRALIHTHQLSFKTPLPVCSCGATKRTHISIVFPVTYSSYIKRHSVSKIFLNKWQLFTHTFYQYPSPYLYTISLRSFTVSPVEELLWPFIIHSSLQKQTTTTDLFK